MISVIAQGRGRWGDCETAFAFASLVRARDATAAALIEIEARRLVAPTEESTADERDALRSLGGGFWFHEMDANVLAIDHTEGLHVWCYDDDLVTLGDRSLRLGARRHAVDAISDLKALFTRRSAKELRSLQLLLFGPVAPFRELLDEVDAREGVTRLVLRREHDEPLTPLADVFPLLVGLEGAADDLPRLLEGGHEALEALVVRAGALSRFAFLSPKLLPGLRHLGVREPNVSAGALRAFLQTPIVGQLRSLDVSSTNHAETFPFDALWDARTHLSHLERIIVGGHLVPERVLRRFAVWSEVTFVGHDRREALAIDLETTGWPFGSR